MSAVFRVWITRTDENGQKTRERSKKFYGQHKNEDDRTVRVPLCEDRSASQSMLTELVRKANRIRSGEIDRFDDNRRRPLEDHLRDFESSLRHKGNTPEHVATTMARVRRVVTGCGLKRIADIDGLAVERYLANLKREEGIGPTTRNHYLTAIKAFCRWLMLERRTADNRLIHLRAENTRCDIRRQRRELAADEISRLLEATQAAKPRWNLSGHQRYLLYSTALQTGLRASELASLTPRSFNFAANQPTVTIDAGNEKARRGATLPLPADLVALLKPWVAKHAFNTRLWPGKWAMQKRAGKMLHADLALAKAAWIDEAKDDLDERAEREQDDFLSAKSASGEQVDFHSLRHTYLSRLARSGANPKVMQLLARHSTVELTIGRYAHASLHDLRAAVDALPALPCVKTLRPDLRATGS